MKQKDMAHRITGVVFTSFTAVCLLMMVPNRNMVRSHSVNDDAVAVFHRNYRQPRYGLFGGPFGPGFPPGLPPGFVPAVAAAPVLGGGLLSGLGVSNSGGSFGGGGTGNDNLPEVAAFTLLGLALIGRMPTQG